MPTWVWMQGTSPEEASSFFLRVAMNTRRDVILFSQAAPQTCRVMYLWVSTFPQFLASRHSSLYSMGVRCISLSARYAQPAA